MVYKRNVNIRILNMWKILNIRFPKSYPNWCSHYINVFKKKNKHLKSSYLAWTIWIIQEKSLMYKTHFKDETILISHFSKTCHLTVNISLNNLSNVPCISFTSIITFHLHIRHSLLLWNSFWGVKVNILYVPFIRAFRKILIQVNILKFRMRLPWEVTAGCDPSPAKRVETD